MSELQVYFEIPSKVSALLGNGTLERVGGVIREKHTKQVVMWLRESIETVKPDTALSTTSPLVPLANMAPLLLTGQLVNMTLSAFTLYTVMQRMERLTKQVDSLGDLIRNEFDSHREDEFSIALKKARDAVESGNPLHRHSDATDTANRLARFTENFLTDLQRTIAKSKDLPHLLLAQQYLTRAIYAQTARIQCYLAVDEEKLAKARLNEDLPQFEQPVQELVKAWMGDYPAIYFHKDVPIELLNRFITLQQLQYDLPPHEAILRVIDQHRGDFWNLQVLPNKTEPVLNLMNPFGGSKNKANSITLEQELEMRLAQMLDQFNGDFWNHLSIPMLSVFNDGLSMIEGTLDAVNPFSGSKTKPNSSPRPITLEQQLNIRLTQAELTMENYRRLLGFELELRTKQLTYPVWNALVDQDQLNQHGIAVIMTSEAHQRLVES